MFHNPMVRVVGGFRDEKTGDFVHVRTAVVREKELGAFFSREDQFRSLPVIFFKAA